MATKAQLKVGKFYVLPGYNNDANQVNSCKPVIYFVIDITFGGTVQFYNVTEGYIVNKYDFEIEPWEVEQIKKKSIIEEHSRTLSGICSCKVKELDAYRKMQESLVVPVLPRRKKKAR